MGSIRNIRQITKAMELIAVTRLRRAQQRVVASRPYADKMRQVLGDLVERIVPPETEAQIEVRAEREARDLEHGYTDTETPHPLLERRPVSRLGVLLLTTDRGLCGALNSNILRTALQYVYARQNEGQAVELIVVGRKGLQAIGRLPLTLTAEFSGLGDYPALNRISPIVRVATDAFTSRQVDEVVLVYPRFVSTMTQIPTVVPLLPIQPPPREEGDTRVHQEADYIYEPDARTVLAEILPRYVEVQVYQAVLELIASEFSSRMVAMRNATDNAGELLDDLQLGYNKARQATITREIIEVSAGANAFANRTRQGREGSPADADPRVTRADPREGGRGEASGRSVPPPRGGAGHAETGQTKRSRLLWQQGRSVGWYRCWARWWTASSPRTRCRASSTPWRSGATRPGRATARRPPRERPRQASARGEP